MQPASHNYFRCLGVFQHSGMCVCQPNKYINKLGYTYFQRLTANLPLTCSERYKLDFSFGETDKLKPTDPVEIKDNWREPENASLKYLKAAHDY